MQAYFHTEPNEADVVSSDFCSGLARPPTSSLPTMKRSPGSTWRGVNQRGRGWPGRAKANFRRDDIDLVWLSVEAGATRYCSHGGKRGQPLCKPCASLCSRIKHMYLTIIVLFFIEVPELPISVSHFTSNWSASRLRKDSFTSQAQYKS